MQRETRHHQRQGLVLFLLLMFPFSWFPNTHDPHGTLPEDKTTKATLCGKLVFIDDVKTGAKLIGLIPCGESRPYIFQSRPGELFNYYRFQDVVIVKDKNMSVSTANYGVLYTYIYKFKDYVSIDSCSACKIYPSTPKPDIGNTILGCSTWILKESTTSLPEINDTMISEEIIADLEQFIHSPDTQALCGSNEDCLGRETGLRLGNSLGELLHQQSITLPKVVFLIKKLMIDPNGAQTCSQISHMVWYLAIGFNQHGYAMDIVQVTSPATPFVMDDQKHRTGILEDGSVVEEIPSSGVAVTSWNISVIFPSIVPTTIQARGTNFGAVDILSLHNLEKLIQETTFEGLLFTQSTVCNLEFFDSRPLLKINTLNDGNVEARNPDSYEEFPLIESRLALPTTTASSSPIPPTASPTLITVQATVTSAPINPETTSTPTNTPKQEPIKPALCPSILGLAIIPLVALRQRKPHGK